MQDGRRNISILRSSFWCLNLSLIRYWREKSSELSWMSKETEKSILTRCCWMPSSSMDKCNNSSRMSITITTQSQTAISWEKQCMSCHGNGGFYGSIILIMLIKIPKLQQSSCYNYSKNSSNCSSNNSSNSNFCNSRTNSIVITTISRII